MKKVLSLCVCLMMFTSMACPTYGKNTITTITNYTSSSHYKYVDLNGDHKKERVGVNVTSSKVRISIKKKFKATINKSSNNQVKLQAFTLGKRHFLALTIGENEGVTEAMPIYQVSKKLKLIACGDLATYASSHFSSAIGLSIVECHHQSFAVMDTIEPNETGLMDITYRFKIKDHQLVSTSHYGKAKLQSRQSLKVYVKHLSLYTSSLSQKVNMIASKGDVLKIVKFYENSGQMALLLKKGEETGYLKLTTSAKDNQKIYKDHVQHGLFFNTGNYFGV